MRKSVIGVKEESQAILDGVGIIIDKGGFLQCGDEGLQGELRIALSKFS